MKLLPQYYLSHTYGGERHCEHRSREVYISVDYKPSGYSPHAICPKCFYELEKEGKARRG